MPKAFTWAIPGKSGYWAAPGNWTDNTDNTTGTLAPGSTDTVSLEGGAGTAFQIIAGPGSAGQLTAFGNIALDGQVTATQLYIGKFPALSFPAGLDNSDALDIDQGALLVTTSFAGLESNLEINGGVFLPNSFDVLDGSNNTPSGAISDDVVVVNGGKLNAATVLSFSAGRLVEDSTGSVEVGTAGGAASGIVTVDAGAVLNVGGTFSLAQNVTDNGDVVLASNGALSGGGAVTGSGLLETAANAQATMTKAVSGLSRVHLAKTSSLDIIDASIVSTSAIVLDAGSKLTVGSLSNNGPVTLGANASLASGDVTGSSTIAVGTGGALTISGTLSGLRGVTMGVNSVLNLSGQDTNVPIDLGTHGNIALNISAGSNIGGTVTGFDASDLIENVPTVDNRDLINRVTYTAGAAGGPGTLTLLDQSAKVTTISLAGSYAGQQFLTNFAGINYGSTDITLPGAFINGIGPGTQTVTGSAGRLFSLVTGSGTSGALTLTANLALSGAYVASSLSTVGSAVGTDDTTDILANSSLTVSGNATVATSVQLTDAGSAFTVGGLLTLGGDPGYEPQVVLAASSRLRAANLTISGSTGQFTLGSNTVPDLAVLGESAVELGTLNLATAGTLAIDPGATLTLAIFGGDVVVPTLIDDGLLTMANSSQGIQKSAYESSITLDTNITGTGAVQANGSLLILGSVTGVSLATGPNGSLTVDGNVSGLQSFSIGQSSSVDFYGLSDTHALEVGASASLSVGGLPGTGVTTGLASLKLDSSASAKFVGPVNSVGPITVGSQGKLEFDKGGSGSGIIALGANATLSDIGMLNGWSGITLASQDAIQTYDGSVIAPAISGFDTSDQINLTSNTLIFGKHYYTGATWTPGSNASGTLTLTEDGQVLQTYTLSGPLAAGYAQQSFITYAGNSLFSSVNEIGTSVVDLGVNAQNGLNGATLAGANGASFMLLTGTGSQSSLTISNDVAIEGSFTLGSVQFESGTVGSSSDDAVLVEQNSQVFATSATVKDVVEATGQGAVLNVAGTLALNDATGNNGLIALNGAVIQAGSTATSAAYDFDTTNVAVDGTASIEIGHAGNAGLGKLTVDAGSTLHTSSQVEFDLQGGMVLNGTWAADSTASNLSGLGAGPSRNDVYGGSVTGTGSLQIDANTFITTLQSVSGLSSVSVAGGGGLSVDDNLLGIGAVTIGAGGSITVGQIGTFNFSAGSLTLADAASNANTVSFSVNGNATGTGMLTVGASDSFQAGGTVSGWSSIVAGSRASLTFNGAEQASPIFLGANTALRIGIGATVSGVINGFAKGDFITYGSVQTANPVITDATWTASSGGLGTLTLSDDGVVKAQFTLAGDYTGERFLTNYAGEPNETVITLADPPCYCPGTLILTTNGEKPVETLAIGDRVVIGSGALEPVVWVGRRSYAGRFARANRGVQPICIKAGALADGVPRRDLWVSPCHAMFLDGVLIPARCLVNGITIVQRAAGAEVHYVHVELAEHSVIWAEGAASESFVDDESRGRFHNAHEFAARYPDASPAPALYCAPRREEGFEVEAVRQRLAFRSAA